MQGKGLLFLSTTYRCSSHYISMRGVSTEPPGWSRGQDGVVLFWELNGRPKEQESTDASH